MAEPAAPVLSVVMPVRDGMDHLPRSLPALAASDLGRDLWELIVVDDGSRDGSAELASLHADRVLRLAQPGNGPPAARNVGAAAARAPIVVFVDADVAVHPDALRRIRDARAADPSLTAVFGAYDLSPAAPGLVSQYRNLLHSYVHRRDAGPAITFWTGIGAVRRGVLEGCGGFDPTERLDDVELGYRMSAAGHRITLDPRIAGSHLKRWTLGSVITTDVLYRGVPWVRLLLKGRQPMHHAPLNIRGLEQILTVLTGVALALATVGVIRGDARWWGAGAVVLGIMVLADARLLRWLAGQRGWLFAAAAAPLRLLYFMVNIVAVALAMLPVSWRRRTPRQRPIAVEQPTARSVVARPARRAEVSRWTPAV